MIELEIGDSVTLVEGPLYGGKLPTTALIWNELPVTRELAPYSPYTAKFTSNWIPENLVMEQVDKYKQLASERICNFIIAYGTNVDKQIPMTYGEMKDRFNNI